MSDLKLTEKQKLEKLLDMGGGYVLNFSNRTFYEFVFEHCRMDIDDEKYSSYGDSKAKRLREFWSLESNQIISKLIFAFLEHIEFLILENEIKPPDSRLIEESRSIAERLASLYADDNDEQSMDVHFEEIRTQIIEQLQQAQYTVWVAVAWFTDQGLFDQLLKLRNRGVNVQVIIVDDGINQSSGIPFKRWFESYRIKQSGSNNNLMHNKFCIIDLKTVLHGSYNWTYRAQYNNETMTIVNGRPNAEKFAIQFIELKTKAMKSV